MPHGFDTRTTERAALYAILLAVSMPGAEIIDRVAVSIDNIVISASEVIRQIHITALLNNEAPDLSASSRREAAERIVDQVLVRREINMSRYVPNNSIHAEAMYKEFRKRFKTDAEYRAALSKASLSDVDMKAAFNWQATFLDFVEVRFRPGITIPEDEIRVTYEEEIKGRTSPEAGLSLEEARPRIEQAMMQQRVDNALDRWLGQVRTQSRILYRKDAFQ